MHKNKGTLFSQTEQKLGLVFENSAYRPRYDRFELLGTLHKMLKIRNPILKKLRTSVGLLFEAAIICLGFDGLLVTLEKY